MGQVLINLDIFCQLGDASDLTKPKHISIYLMCFKWILFLRIWERIEGEERGRGGEKKKIIYLNKVNKKYFLLMMRDNERNGLFASTETIE